MENQNEKSVDSLELGLDSSDGLVFETDKNKKNTVADERFIFETHKDAQTTPQAEKDEEFTVPEKHAFQDENGDFHKGTGERTRIYTTYVPRFTGVSDTYRMKDDPRPLPKSDEPCDDVAKEKSISIENEALINSYAPTVKAIGINASEFENEQEPTVAATNVVIGKSSDSSAESYEESFEIFKFPVEELSDADRLTIEEENANRKALEEHRAKKAAQRAKEEADRLAAEEAEREAEHALHYTKLSPDEYDIPDPDQTGFVSTEKRAELDADYDVPHGIPDETEKIRKLKVFEYTASGQRDSFKDKFLDSLLAMKIRISALVILAFVSLLLGNSTLFGFDIPRAFGVEYVPAALALIDFQVVICAFLIVIPEIIMAVTALYNKVVLTEISLFVSFLVLAVNTLMIVSFNYMGYPVFGFLFVLSALGVLISHYVKKKADFECFKFVSAKNEKKIIEQEETRKYARTMLALDGAIDGYKSSTAKIFRTPFVADFFKNTSKYAENTKNNIIMLASSFAAALISALIAGLVAESNGMSHAVAAFTLVCLFSMPIAFFFLHKLSYYHASKEVALENGAIVGEYAYTDISGIDVMAFEDTDIFGEDDVNLKRFSFYGGEDSMNRGMRLMSSLFSSIGGPLNIIFAKTLEKRCTPATNPVIEEDGVSGNIDGKIVCAGNADYMHRHGIKIPVDKERSYGVGAESMKIMYGAEDGVVFAKFYIRYSFSEEFTSLLADLREENIVPLVYTSDPNVSNELLRTLAMGADRMRVMRRSLPKGATDKMYPRLSANAVTTGDVVNTIRLVLIAKKYRCFMNVLEKASIITMASCTGFAALAAVFGFTALPTAILGFIQLAICGTLWYFSKKKFDTSKKQKGI